MVRYRNENDPFTTIRVLKEDKDKFDTLLVGREKDHEVFKRVMDKFFNKIVKIEKKTEAKYIDKLQQGKKRK